MKPLGVTLVALCIAASAFSQGLVWQSKTEGAVKERMTENFAMPKMFKTVRSEDVKEGAIVIFRLDKELLWTLNPEKKTYSEMTFAEMEKLMSKAGGKMDAAMAKMEEQMKDMTPEQREMMQKMMGGKMPGAGSSKPTQVKNTGERKTISGYACTKFVVTDDEKDFMTLWVTRDVRGFEPLMADWKEFSKRMGAMNRFAKGAVDAYKNIEGFPIETTVSMMNTTVTTTVTKIERRSTPANEFQVPSGYTKVKSQLEDALEKMDDED